MPQVTGEESLRKGFPTLRAGRRAGARIALAAGLLTALVATVDASQRPYHRAGRFDQGGIVYAMTNDSDGNEILVYFRNRSGRLHAVRGGTVRTGGKGGSVTAEVDPLGSQNSLIYDGMHDSLFAVNAGSDTVTSFDTRFAGVPARWSRKTAPSGGNIPVSLTVLEDKLFVLNAGGTGSVGTIHIGQNGELTLLDSLDLELTPKATTPPFNQVMAPGQIGVDTLSRQLIVTYGGGQAVLTIALDDDGVPVGPVVSTPSPGVVPFAFDVTPYGSILVAEAGSGAVSAYDPPIGISPLNLTAASVATGQMATCWIAVHPGGFAYVTNTGSDTLSLYQYTRTGGLALVDAIAATAKGKPTDMTIAGGGDFIYTLNAASGEISGFAVAPESGALTLIETEAGLPANAGIQGIASREPGD